MESYLKLVNPLFSSNDTIPTLDAIRGAAALVVLAAHTNLIPTELGSYGVIAFFCLSGFLLTSTFLNGEMLSVMKIAAYFNKRLWRILPMYFFYIFLASFFYGGTEWFINHALFIKSDGHLWTIKQELCFYMLLPLVILFIYPLRGSPALSGLVLVFLAYITGIFPTEKFLSSTDMYGERIKLYISPFICGMATSYFYKAYTPLKLKYLSQNHLAVISIILTTSLFALFALNRKAVWHHSGFEAGLIFCPVMLSLLMISNSTFLTLLTPIRAIGKVSYSFYLLHWILKDIFAPLSTVAYIHFVSTLIVTYLLSALTCKLIESPSRVAGTKLMSELEFLAASWGKFIPPNLTTNIQLMPQKWPIKALKVIKFLK